MSIWLIVSLAVGVVVLFLLFLFVLKAHKKFRQVKEILRSIDTSNKVTPIELFEINKDTEEFLDTSIVEGKDYSYFPNTKMVCVEQGYVYSTAMFDVTAIAHEMGHAKAHYKGSFKMALWYALTTLERFICWAILPLFVIGFILSWFSGGTGTLGTLLMNLSTTFTVIILMNRVITIPTEREASKYGIKLLENSKLLTENEIKMSKKMLNIALSTYVFAFYERLFHNFILAKKIFSKIFLRNKKPKPPSQKEIEEEQKLQELMSEIQKDSVLDKEPTTEELNLQKQIEEEELLKAQQEEFLRQQQEEANTIRRPPLDDEK